MSSVWKRKGTGCNLLFLLQHLRLAASPPPFVAAAMRSFLCALGIQPMYHVNQMLGQATFMASTASSAASLPNKNRYFTVRLLWHLYKYRVASDTDPTSASPLACLAHWWVSGSMSRVHVSLTSAVWNPLELWQVCMPKLYRKAQI